MVRGIEDLRTPLREIIQLDKQCRGTLSGFMMPSFVIDLPGGGGKRLVSTYETYDESTGEATYTAPGLPGQKGQMTYTYWDPMPVTETDILEHRQRQEQALMDGKTLEQQDSAAVPPVQHQPQENVYREEMPTHRLSAHDLVVAAQARPQQQDHKSSYPNTNRFRIDLAASRPRGSAQSHVNTVPSDMLHIDDAWPAEAARASTP